MSDEYLSHGLPDAVDEWLASHGYSVAIHEADGFFWADLLDAQGLLFWPRYGRGNSPAEAAERVMARYEEEQ